MIDLFCVLIENLTLSFMSIIVLVYSFNKQYGSIVCNKDKYILLEKVFIS